MTKMLDHFPAEEFARMLQNIDRFDVDGVKDNKVNADKIIDKAEELTNQIVEENL